MPDHMLLKESFLTDALKPYARKYLWWKTPEEAISMPERVIAQVMNLGGADVQALAALVGDEVRAKWCDTPRLASSMNAPGRIGIIVLILPS